MRQRDVGLPYCGLSDVRANAVIQGGPQSFPLPPKMRTIFGIHLPAITVTRGSQNGREKMGKSYLEEKLVDPLAFPDRIRPKPLYRLGPRFCVVSSLAREFRSRVIFRSFYFSRSFYFALR